MEMDITLWMERFVAAVCKAFGSRVCCIGLQGSRARGEAAEDSDIDVVVILDAWRAADWAIYEEILHSLPERDKVCGFVSGKEELLHWEPSELFGFYYDTEPWYGDLEALKACFDMEDARRAVHMGACGIYHACAHNRLHAKDWTVLRELYKSAFFILRAAYYCRTGEFVRRRADLLPLLHAEEREILAAGFAETENAELFALRSNQLLVWAGGLICGRSGAERG
ncbi:MAG: nucleotidyltransferase domain-containing protein [Agathobaculum sp.]|jgi:predicted nucleotidyltransferase|uniref:nucleotidyltransferase domain-containing protein n=1 Tax=Agathobaculum sp. TaxID=2048138 RepID=UPI003D8A7A63